MSFGLAYGALLLVVSAIVKLVDPHSFRDVLRNLRLPSAVSVVYTLAGIELGVGLLTLTLGSVIPRILQLALYLGFVAALLVLRARGSSSCGCFGTESAPTLLQVGLDAGITLVTLGSVLGESPPVLELLATPGASLESQLTVAFALGVAVWLSVVAVTFTPKAFKAWERPVENAGSSWRWYEPRRTRGITP